MDNPTLPMVHTIIDIVTPSVVTVGRVARAAASRLVAAEGAEADKRGVFGNILANTLVPFAIEDGGSLGKDSGSWALQAPPVDMREPGPLP